MRPESVVLPFVIIAFSYTLLLKSIYGDVVSMTLNVFNMFNIISLQRI